MFVAQLEAGMGTKYENNGRALGDNYCFACGLDNPYGLKLDFRIEGDCFVTETTLAREYQSYTGVAHGGIVSTLLDEAMGGYLVALGEKAVTGRLSVRFRHPTPIGETLRIEGKIESRRSRFVTMTATVALADGTVTAEGKADMVVVE
jgi:acyl-coenzyme A thioesterase PaaI-like protein